MMRAFPTSVRSTQLDKEAGMEDSLRKKKERGGGVYGTGYGMFSLERKSKTFF